MADSDKIPQIDPTEIEILIEKFEQNKLEERERRLIVALLRTFLYIVAQLQEKSVPAVRKLNSAFRLILARWTGLSRDFGARGAAAF